MALKEGDIVTVTPNNPGDISEFQAVVHLVGGKLCIECGDKKIPVGDLKKTCTIEKL